MNCPNCACEACVGERSRLQKYHDDVALTRTKLESGEPFTEEELCYSRHSRCPCGAGLAYPKGVGAQGYWDCSAILKKVANPEAKHTGQLPFFLYSIKSDSETPGVTTSTRPAAGG